MEEINLDTEVELNDGLDNSWIKEFEDEDNIYKDFYKESVQTVKIILFYIDTNNSITSGKKLLMPLDNGVLKKNVLIKTIHYIL